MSHAVPCVICGGPACQALDPKRATSSKCAAEFAVCEKCRGEDEVSETHEEAGQVEPMTSSGEYEAFLSRKATAPMATGFVTDAPLNAHLFDWQRDTVRWALARGRAALFEECGLGKTIQELEWSRLVAEHTGKPALIFAPLAVSKQTIREGQKFGIGVTYAHDDSEVTGAGIFITNYERLERFDPARFGGVVIDESGILKSYTGKTKRLLCDMFAGTRFRLACTATPAPNDHLELGNHAEFLGVLSSHEMIARWFINDSSTFGTYRLKGHAVEPFWDWVTSWARCVGRPSDLGATYSDVGYVLPELRTHKHVVDVDVVEGRGEMLFRVPEMSATSVHAEKRRSAPARAAKVAELVHAEPDEDWIVWCDTDYEADALVEAIGPGAVEVRGSDSPEHKEAAIGWFCRWADEPPGKNAGTSRRGRVLVSKSSIFGWGLNLQGCARVAFVGATFSFEAFYQAIRRSWRFGQQRPVNAHVVMASTEMAVWTILQEKAVAHEQMKDAMFAATRRAQSKEDSRRHAYVATRAAVIPEWLVEEAAQ